MQQVILAAGKGSRLGLNISNKCLVEINGKTLIEHNLELSKYIDASEILIVVGYNKSHIIDKIGENYNGIPVNYVTQERQLGVADGIKAAGNYIKGSFFMCLSDEILFAPEIKKRSASFVSDDADCGCGVVYDSPMNIRKAYTVNIDEKNRITGVIEKPDKTYNSFKGTGYCFMKPTMLDCLSDLKPNPIRNEYEMGDWINLAVERGLRCMAYVIGQASFNINERSDIQSAEEYTVKGSM